MQDEKTPVPLRRTQQLPAAQVHPALTAIAGQEAGRVYELGAGETTLGRSSDADVYVPVDGVSRLHAKIVHEADDHLTIIDLDSTNGVWVEGTRVRSHLLREGERIQLGANAVFQFGIPSATREEVQRQLYDAATRDPLTGALNRRMFDEHLARELSHTRRHGSAINLIVLEVDQLAKGSEEYGARATDQILRGLAAVVTESIRFEDLFCRVGANEFAIIMRDSAEGGPTQFGDRLRGLVEGHYFAHEGRRLPVTICAGIAAFAPEYPTPEALFAAAENALYEAQRNGPNRVCHAE